MNWNTRPAPRNVDHHTHRTRPRHTGECNSKPPLGRRRLRWDPALLPPELRHEFEQSTAHSSTTGLKRQPPPPGPWAVSMARGLIEVLQGLRPAKQLERWLTPMLYSHLVRLLPGIRPASPRTSTCHVVSSRLCEVRSGVVEAAVLLRVAGRTHVVALRLEDSRGRWLTTALDIA